VAETISGKLDASGRRFGVVAARFNEFITTRLVEGALDALTRHGADPTAIIQAWAPGSFELPLLAKRLAQARPLDAVICVGCLIRGQTPHFDYIASSCAKGIGQVALELGKPVVFGVITADTLEQAIDRAGGKAGNKGAEAALAAIEMVNVLDRLAK
jgi:6,7-dimethyl-8-ribityllumazine synthase